MDVLKRKVSMMDLDSLKDIDLASVPSSVWEIELEVLKTSRSLSLLNIPSGITLLDLGSLLSRSLSEPFHLPMSLNSYKGPFLSGMVFPPNIESIHLIETQKSMPSSSIAFPTRTKKITVENPLKFSDLDSIHIPESVESFTVVGLYNCSFEKLKLPPGIIHLDLGKSTQPTDLLNTSLLTDVVQSTQVNRQILEKSPLLFTSTNKKLLNALHNHKPRIDRLQVVLDNVYSTIGDVWTDVLLEGRIQVRELILVNGTGNTCLSDCEDVFRRSKKLDRKLCKNLLILCETFSYASHLNLSRSLTYLGDISIEISYFKKKPTECIVPRLADILGIEKNDSQYSSNKFGVISTTVSMSSDGNLKFVIGSSPMKYSVPLRTSSSVPVSSSTLMDTPTPMEPGPKTIILHTWTKCSFCDKQDGYIEEFKKTSEKHRNVFNDMVEIKKIENPEDIDDKRVDSFPTWVKDGELIVGTQNKTKLEEMLLINS